MPADAALLSEIPFFHFLDDNERVSLAAPLAEVRPDAGPVLVNYGEPGEFRIMVGSSSRTEDLHSMMLLVK